MTLSSAVYKQPGKNSWVCHCFCPGQLQRQMEAHWVLYSASLLFFRSQDGLLVPHNLPSRNDFVKALQEAFESTLKEVRASFSIASRFATSLGAAAGKQLTLVDTLHSVICPEQPSHGVKQDGGEFVECGGRKTTFCSCCQSPKLILHSGPISSLVLPSWSCPTCPVPSQECHTASSVCLREHFPGPHLIVSFPFSTSS